MKKFTIISITAFAALCTACSSADDFADNTTVKEGNVKVTLSATLPSSNTRTVLTDGGTGGMAQTWAATDEIKVVNANQSYEAQTFSTTGSGTSKTASFTGSLTNPTNGDQLYAFYPSSLATPAIVGTPTAASVSVDYSSQDGTLAGAASKAVMYAGGTYNSSGSTNLGTFTNAGAILRIKMTFPSEVTIKKVAIVANGLVNKEDLSLSKAENVFSATWSNPVNGGMIASLGSTGLTGTSITTYMAAIPQSGLKSVTAIAMTGDATPAYYTCQLGASSVAFAKNMVYTLNFANMVNTDITYTGNETDTGIAPLDMDEDGNYEMVLAENFKYLQADANLVTDAGGNNVTTGKTYKLMKNMSIANTVNWIPIGGSAFFNGSFDGNGKTVSGVNYSGSTYTYYGFFGYTYDSTIKNLTVEGGTINNTAPGSTTGGLVGSADSYLDSSHIIGCTTKYTSISATAENAELGGLIGASMDMTNGVYIFGCRSDVTTISSGWCAGGILGYGSGTKISMMICLTNCGTVTSTASSYPYAGGLVGRFDSPSIVKGCISCCNSISATGSQAYKGALFGVIAKDNFTTDKIVQCWWKANGTNIPTRADGNTLNPESIANVGSKSSVSDFNEATFIDNLNTAAQVTSGYRFMKSTVTDLPTIEKAPAD